MVDLPRKRAGRRARVANRGAIKPKRTESTVTIIDRLLLQPMQIVLNGEPQKATALRAIVMHLVRKAVSGNERAYRVLMKYREFAALNLDKELELTFVESEYTRALANPARGNDEQ
jgi:hypothetical protein